MKQITTVTFFRFESGKDKHWGTSQMHFAHKTLKTLPGLSFYKLMGSGQGDGFKLWPDLTTFCLWQVWESEEAAEVFLKSSTLMEEYRLHASQTWTLYMECIVSKGKWSKVEPFLPNPELKSATTQIVVLTRASIKWYKFIPFWRFVPKSHPKIEDVPGLIYTKGIGDTPLFQMATFSFWTNMEDMMNFAYRSSEHVEAMKRNAKYKWFQEELFARFQVYKQEGNWEDKAIPA